MQLLKMNSSIATGLLVGAGLLASGSASAIVVGGVDFGVPGTSHLETTTLAETLITGNGQILTGYGQVNTVNGDIGYAGGDRLYFTFTNYVSANFSGAAVDFSGGVISVYKGLTFNLLNQSSATNIGIIQSYTPWVTLTGHADASTYTLQANGTLTGTVINFTGAGLLDVSGGQADVVSFLDADTIADGVGGFADVSLTTSGNNLVLNRFDTCTGLAGQYCVAGSADLRGDTVIPEPGSMALVGLALLGLGLARKRKSA